jgi:hypothetical protein
MINGAAVTADEWSVREGLKFAEELLAAEKGNGHVTSRRTLRRDEALAELEAIGFECSLESQTIANIVEAGFDKRTLAQSLVLAQILADQNPISVRGAFYRAVSAGMYPDTGEKHYRQASAIILKLRRAGLVPYSWIADSTRIRRKPSSWSGLADFGETVRSAYRKDFWASQRAYIEVFVEKDAMAGVLGPVTDEYDIYLNVVRGNASETFLWNCAEQLKEIEKPIFIFYFGDHDPNGLDIERATFAYERKACASPDPRLKALGHVLYKLQNQFRDGLHKAMKEIQQRESEFVIK